MLFKYSPTSGAGAPSPPPLPARALSKSTSLTPLPEFIFRVCHWLDNKQLAKNVFPCWDETIYNFLKNF